jgi:3-isopropylmalate dehydrogenase
MATHKLLLLPGDGIGTEVMAEVKRIIDFFNKKGPDKFTTEEALVGGACYDAHGVAITDQTMDKAKAADAVIFGAVGGPKWDKVPYESRPEAGLLRLRKDLDLYANLRPAVTYPALADASSLKRELVEGLDIMILRELTGGVYFGEPKTITDLGNGQKRAIDTQVYDTYEIERISRVAFELARKRRNKVTSMEKHNVMKSGVLWKEVVGQVHQREFKDVELQHMLADAGGMQLVRNPKQFDVIVCDNLFGDMLSDVAAMLTGSLGMLASASLGGVDPKTKKRKALYEPVHGSAPDIAGKGVANPIAMIASFAMALRYSFDLGKEADLIDRAGAWNGAHDELAIDSSGGVDLIEQHSHRHARVVISKPLESSEHLPGNDLLARSRNQPVVEEDRRAGIPEATDGNLGLPEPRLKVPPVA